MYLIYTYRAAIHSPIIMGICGAYGIRPYTGIPKMGRYG